MDTKLMFMEDESSAVDARKRTWKQEGDSWHLGNRIQVRQEDGAWRWIKRSQTGGTMKSRQYKSALEAMSAY